MANPYLYDDAPVLKNKLGVKDPNVMDALEAALPGFRASELKAEPIPGRYDLDHMKKVHEHLFQDLFEWAGKPRTLNFSKSAPGNLRGQFADVTEVESLLNEVAEIIEANNGFKGLDKETFAKAITPVYAKMNQAHPFPEGNGRTTQTLMGQLAKEAGHTLDFSQIVKNEWIMASVKSMPHVKEYRDFGNIDQELDFAPLEKVLAKIVQNVEIEQFKTQNFVNSSDPFVPYIIGEVVHQSSDAIKLFDIRESAIQDFDNEELNQQPNKGDRVLIAFDTIGLGIVQPLTKPFTHDENNALLKVVIDELEGKNHVREGKPGYTYEGEVEATTNEHVIQRIGQSNTFVVHDKTDFEEVPKIGDFLKIQHSKEQDGKAAVKHIEPPSKGNSQVHER